MTSNSIRGLVAVAGVVAVVASMAGTRAEPARSGTTVTAAPAQMKSAAKDVKDFWIKTKIHSQFAMEDSLEGSNIDVDIKRGAVVLNGTVTTEAARSKAVSLARSTDGVNGVTNNLTVAPGENAIDPQKIREAGRNVGRIVTDGWVKSTIYARFLAEKSLEDSDINVDVKHGVVTLKGTVPTEAGRARAIEVAKSTPGTKSVNDTMKIG
jgi:hyperosmotically inducible protein